MFRVLVRSKEGHRCVGGRWEDIYSWNTHVILPEDEAEDEAMRLRLAGSKVRVVDAEEWS